MLKFVFISGNANVPVANCNQKYFNSQCKNFMTFSEYAEYWKNFIGKNYPSDTEPCLYLKVSRNIIFRFLLK